LGYAADTYLNDCFDHVDYIVHYLSYYYEKSN